MGIHLSQKQKSLRSNLDYLISIKDLRSKKLNDLRESQNYAGFIQTTKENLGIIITELALYETILFIIYKVLVYI